MGDWVGFQSFLIKLFPGWQRRGVKRILEIIFTNGAKNFINFWMKPKKMGFIKILSYLYSKINSFEYSKV